MARRAVEAAQAAGAGQAEAWAEETAAARSACTRARSRASATRAGAGSGSARSSTAAAGYAYGTDLERRGPAALAGGRGGGGRGGRPRRVRRPARGDRRHARSGPALARAGGLGHRAQGGPGAGGGARGALARRAYRRSRTPSTPTARARVAHRQLARLRGRLQPQPGAGLRVGVRRRGRGPDDRPGRGLARDPGGLDAEAIGDEAAERALALVGARQPASRRCPVVLDAFVAASFVGFIGAMLSADAVQRGRSLFAGREGEEVADPAFALSDDGAHPEGPASAPFDGEGSPTRRTPLIEDGRLAGRTCSTRAPPARRAGPPPATPAAAPTAPSPRWAPRTCSLEPGERSARRAGRARPATGLLVTDVAGLHSGVNPVSGTFSVGADGQADRGRRAGPAGARDHHRQRPGGHAQGGPGGGVGGRAGSPSEAA